MTPSYIDLTGHISKTIEHFLNQNPYSKLGILVDENTALHCYPIVKEDIPAHAFFKISAGEEHKNLQTCEKIWQWMTQEKFDRKSLLINLGGGVIGDMGGFCAASYKRGIRFINIPTTLLAMVDASIGGKLGIDFMGFKNHIGFFANPDKVLIHVGFLKTLPREEIRSGYAEIIKHTLIADAAFWPEIMQTKIEAADWDKFIHHSIAIKDKVVKQDPEERNLRKILNFGHTIGHAIESFYLQKKTKLLHGEAIAIGMICEAYISKELHQLPENLYFQIRNYVKKVFGQLDLNKEDFKAITDNCLQDKKNENNSIRFVLLKNIGDAVFDVPVPEDLIVESLNAYKQEKS